MIKRRKANDIKAHSTALAAALACLAILLSVLAAGASAETICVVGTGAKNCLEPQNMAVDAEAQRLYVADKGNNRIDVYNTATGLFIETLGSAGSGPGQFLKPWGVAVDDDPLSLSYHDVYVTEGGEENEHPRLQKLSETGQFIWMAGGGVNKTTTGDLCTAASGNTCGAAASGAAEGEFMGNVIGRSPFVGTGPGGAVYAVDTVKNGSAFEARLQRFEEGGAEVSPQKLLPKETRPVVGLAVEPGGDFWLAAESGLVEEYEVNGTAVPGRRIQTPTAYAVPSGLAVNAEGHLFVADNTVGSSKVEEARTGIIEYSSEGKILRRFGYGAFGGNPIRGLAAYHSGLGDVYASEGAASREGRVLAVPFPAAGPIVLPLPCEVPAATLRSSKATLKAEVNPEGKATSYRFQYVTEAHFQAEGFANANETVPGSPIGTAGVHENFELEPAVATVEGLTPGTVYRCRVVASDSEAHVTIGEEGAFQTKPPVEFLGRPWVSEVGSETARISQAFNPLEIDTKGYFEYVDDEDFMAGGFTGAAVTPEVDFGSGDEEVTGRVGLVRLRPGTLYHYRLHVADSYFPFPGGRLGPEGTLRTYGSAIVSLPDGRRYELVSPVQKNGGEVGVPSKAGGLWNGGNDVRVEAAAGSGEEVTYTSWTSFGEAQGAPSSSQYLSRRGSGGWTTENISAGGFERDALNVPFLGFSPDLEWAGFEVDEPALVEGALNGMQNLYVRHDDASGALAALTREPAPSFTAVSAQGLGSFCTSYAGSSEDGSRSFFAANGAFAQAGAVTGVGFSLYERSASGLSLVSVLPGGEPAPPQPATRFGDDRGFCSMDQGNVAHAVSSDGSIVYWRYGGEYVNGKGKAVKKPLLARIDGNRTVELDGEQANNGGKGPYGEGTFWAGTPSGSYAFFTAPGRLTSAEAGLAGAEGQLYRFDASAETLQDLTPGFTDPQVEGVVGASTDGSYVYFVASAELAAGAKTGANNLYVWHEGEPIQFIAQLSSETDGGDWSNSTETLSARVSGDGKHLAFLTSETEALSGYDNTVEGSKGHCQIEEGIEHRAQNDLIGGPRCLEAYIYDAPTKTLTCASCNPSGARPLGPAQLPGWSNPLEGPRYLSEDGSRLFFETLDSLVPEDVNGKRDVYEFEFAGTGSCSSSSPGFSPSSGGCLSTISDPASSDNSYLLDASADGRDVFFATRQSLVGWDTDVYYDVYDAREGGGFPEPPPSPPACEGEASCRSALSAPPSVFAPASASLQGAGNLVVAPEGHVSKQAGKAPAKCKKGFTRRRGRCVRSHVKKKNKKRGGGGKKRRRSAGRGKSVGHKSGSGARR